MHISYRRAWLDLPPMLAVFHRQNPSAILPEDWPAMVHAGFPSLRNMHARDKGASAVQHFPGRFV